MTLPDIANRRRYCVLSCVILMLSACAAPPPAPDIPVGAPPDFPVERYRSPAAGERIYAIDPDRSLVRVLALRGGALKRLGHDHVIASRDVAGFVRRFSTGGQSSRLEGDFYVALAALTVDEEALRQRAGFTTEPSDDDRAGTRSNMLKSLEANAYPFVTASVRTGAVEASATGQGVTANLELTLHGVTQTVAVPVTVSLEGAALSALGRFELKQTDYGITPFSVLGGALAVQDTLEIQFELHASETGS